MGGREVQLDIGWADGSTLVIHPEYIWGGISGPLLKDKPQTMEATLLPRRPLRGPAGWQSAQLLPVPSDLPEKVPLEYLAGCSGVGGRCLPGDSETGHGLTRRPHALRCPMVRGLGSVAQRLGCISPGLPDPARAGPTPVAIRRLATSASVPWFLWLPRAARRRWQRGFVGSLRATAPVREKRSGGLTTPASGPARCPGPRPA